jgi:hypothetical protein
MRLGLASLVRHFCASAAPEFHRLAFAANEWFMLARGVVATERNGIDERTRMRKQLVAKLEETHKCAR